MNSKENLKKFLKSKSINHVPFIVPGGFMRELPHDFVMDNTIELKKLYNDRKYINEVSNAFYKNSFDNLSIPFLMTAESQAYNGEVEILDNQDDGNYEMPFDEIGDYDSFSGLYMQRKRMPLINQITTDLKASAGNKILTADLIAPAALASSLIDGKKLIKSFANDKVLLKDFFDFLYNNSIEYAKSLKAKGVDVFIIQESFLDPQFIGLENFKEFAVDYINKFSAELCDEDVFLVAHFCADITDCSDLIKEVDAFISFDSNSDFSKIKITLQDKVILAPLSRDVLYKEKTEVRKEIELFTKEGADIITTDCGLMNKVKYENLQYVKESIENFS